MDSARIYMTARATADPGVVGYAESRWNDAPSPPGGAGLYDRLAEAIPLSKGRIGQLVRALASGVSERKIAAG